MIRFEPRNVDVQGTERVFKKVIHPSNNSIRLVDKDGIPLRTPTSAMLSRLHSTFVLSPRGVPTRKSNHAYSGQLAQGKMHHTVHSLDSNQQHAPEMASYNSMHTYGMNSAGSSRHYIPANMSASKKRTFGSGPPRVVKQSMVKSASTDHTRYLTATPEENIELDPDDPDNWNGSPQGKRLEKEWSAMSQCRALKRSSEIVSHRIDQMYFMSGNKLNLNQKFHVEDKELRKLKDLAQARASSRASRDEMRAQATTLMSRREYVENEGRLEQIERKLSNIEHRLSFIEEQAEEREVRDVPREPVGSTICSTSESGIQEDEDQLVYDPDEDAVSVKSVDREAARTPERGVSKVEIRALGCSKECAGIQVWDIMSHDKSSTQAETMMKLFETYPNVHERARLGWETNTYDTTNALTLGVPRKIRQTKVKTAQKRKTSRNVTQEEFVSPNCQMCKSNKSNAKVKPNTSGQYVPRDRRTDHSKQSFPARRPRVKILHHQPPVECDCRYDSHTKRKGPLLAVQGRQVPLCDREYLYA